MRHATVRTALAQSFLDSFQVLFPGAILVAGHVPRSEVRGRGKDLAWAPGRLLRVRGVLGAPDPDPDGGRDQLVGGDGGRGPRHLGAQPRPGPESRAEFADDVPSQRRRRGRSQTAAPGLTVEPGALTAVVSPDPDEASELAARLGRYSDAPPGEWVSIAGVRVDELPIDVVRKHVLVVDREPQLLAGHDRHRRWTPRTSGPDDVRDTPDVKEALEAAAAGDIVDGLAEGLETELPEMAGAFREDSASGSSSRRLCAPTPRSSS